MPKKGQPMPYELQKATIRRMLQFAIKRGDVPETIDIDAVLDLIDPTLTLEENITNIERTYGFKLRKQKPLAKKIEKKLERKEEIEAFFSGEAAIICEKYPHICDKYPLVPEYMVEQRIYASQVEPIIEEMPELFKQLDGITLRELISEYPFMKRVKKFIEKYNPPEDIKEMLLDLELDRSVKEQIMKEYKEKVEKPIKPEAKPKPKPKPKPIAKEIPKPKPTTPKWELTLDQILDKIKTMKPDKVSITYSALDSPNLVIKYNGERDTITTISLDEVSKLIDQLKMYGFRLVKKGQVGYTSLYATLEFKKPLVAITPEAMIKKTKPYIPEITREEELIMKGKKEIWETPESERDLARQILRKLYGIEAERIDYIIKYTPEKWIVVGVDKTGLTFSKEITVQGKKWWD